MNDFTPAIITLKNWLRIAQSCLSKRLTLRVISGWNPHFSRLRISMLTAPNTKDRVVNVAFVIPKEGSCFCLYVMSGGGRIHQTLKNGHKVLDFVLSNKGQAVYGKKPYLRPVSPSAMTPGDFESENSCQGCQITSGKNGRTLPDGWKHKAVLLAWFGMKSLINEGS